MRLSASITMCILKSKSMGALCLQDMGLAQIDVPKPAGIYGYSGDAGNISTPNLAKYASEGLKDDRELVMEAVKQSGYALQYASKGLQKDEEMLRLK